jgi:hypothetical protein
MVRLGPDGAGGTLDRPHVRPMDSSVQVLGSVSSLAELEQVLAGFAAGLDAWERLLADALRGCATGELTMSSTVTRAKTPGIACSATTCATAAIRSST